MEFEFDPAKSAINKRKHGIDFVEAQALWAPGAGLMVPARSADEERYAVIAVLGDKLWVGFFTLRGGIIRIISVRRARDEEKRRYEDHIRS